LFAQLFGTVKVINVHLAEFIERYDGTIAIGPGLLK
jgi:hypothetical protein